jgi:hypothetical protein
MSPTLAPKPAEAQPTVLDLMAKLPQWFGAPSWDAWRTLLASLFGLPMSPEQVATYRRFTGRVAPPTVPAREGYLVVGRRGGKSIIAALIALWASVFRSYAGAAAPGESLVVMVVASDRRQASVIFKYLLSFFDRVPGLAALVRARRKEALVLTNGVGVEIHACSYRAVRGPTVVALIADELAFWRSETSASPDREVLDAIRPSQLTVREPVFLCISSPYARRGELWRNYAAHYGVEGDRTLVWAADSASMNPVIDRQVVLDAFSADESVAWSEYGRDGEIRFRSDLESYVSKDTIDLCTIAGRVGVPPVTTERYCGFVDVAGGSGGDAFAWAVAHAEQRGGRRIVALDLCGERRPPFSPEAVVTECCGQLAQYGVRTIVGDRYAGSWPAEQFAKQGVTYEPAERTKSAIYQDCLPLLTSGSVELLDLPKLHAQLQGLERRTARGGRDSIDHGPNGHDDLANSACGALLLAASGVHAEPVRLWGCGDWAQPEDED